VVLMACTLFLHTTSMLRYCNRLDNNTVQVLAVAGWMGLLVVMAYYATSNRHNLRHADMAAVVCAVGLLLTVFHGNTDGIWYVLGAVLVHAQTRLYVLCYLAEIWHGTVVWRRTA